MRDWLALGADGLHLTQLDRLVLENLASYMDPDGTNAYPGAETLAAIAGSKSEDARAIKKSCERLRRLVLIEPTIEHPRIGERQVWQLTENFANRLLDLSKRGNPQTPSNDKEREPTARRGGTHSAERGKPRSPLPSLPSKTGDLDHGGDPEAATVEVPNLTRDEAETARLWPQLNGEAGRQWVARTTPWRELVKDHPRQAGESDDEYRARVEAAAP